MGLCSIPSFARMEATCRPTDPIDIDGSSAIQRLLSQRASSRATARSLRLRTEHGQLARRAPGMPGTGGVGHGGAAPVANRNSRQSPSKNEKTRSPSGRNFRPEPTTESLTVLETTTCPASACPATRAPSWTATPATPVPVAAASPACSPARVRRPSRCAPLPPSSAQWAANAGPSKATKHPSIVHTAARPRNQLCRVSP